MYILSQQSRSESGGKTGRDACSFWRVAAFALVVGVLAVAAGAGTASAQVASCSDDITTSGFYTVDSDITDSGASSCIDITASNVTLEGNDNTVDGDDQDSGSIGVNVVASTTLTNVTVRNLTVTGWEDGVVYDDADGGNITDVSATGNTGRGIFLDSSSDNEVTENNVTGNNDGSGIRLDSSSGNDVMSNNATGNDRNGILLQASSNNNMTANNASGNNLDGITLDLGSDNNNVMSNNASGNDDGILLVSSSGNDVMSNEASGNADNGIFLGSSSNNNFTDNTAQNNADSDFRVVDSSGNVVENLDIGESTAPETTLDFTGNNFELNGTGSPPADPSGEQNIGRFVDATNISASGSFLDLTFEYTDSDVSGVDESTLDVWRNDGTWTELGTGPATDPAANEVQYNITNFGSIFAPLANTTAAQTQPTNFDAEIVATTSPINAGENLDVAAEITNNGNSTETGNITLITSEVGVSGKKVRDLRQITLNPGESREFLLSWNTTAGDEGDYIAEVGVPNGGDTTNVTVGPAQTDPKFEVDIKGTTSPAQAGDELSVVANVENVGNDAGNATVELFANGSVRDNRTVNLDGGDDRSVSLVWDTTAGDAGDRAIEVRTAKDSDTEIVEIGEPPAPAEFEVGIDSTTAPVSAGETLGVVAAVENVGDETENETVRLLVDGNEVDNRTKKVRGGEDRTFGLFWDTDETDAGTATIEVVGADDSASTSVTVGPPPTNATFDVEVVETTAPVEAGNTLEVEARVENIGDIGNVGEVSLRAAGAERDNRTVDLAGAGEPGSVDTVVLRWETTESDAGERIIEVTTNRSISDAERVTVEEPPSSADFEPQIEFTTSPVQEGDTLAVQANVENVGDLNGTQEVSLEVGGSERDNETVALDGGEDRSVVLTWATTTGDAGDYLAEVTTDDDIATTVATVEEAPEADFGVTIDDTTSPVQAGGTLQVVATVENTGDAAATETVELLASGSVQDSETVAPDAGDSQQVVLEWTTTAGDAGENFVAATVSNSSDVAEVTVEGPPTPANFEVDIVDTTSPVRAGETLEVVASVENVGETAGTGPVELNVSGERRDTRTLDLNPGETKDAVLTWDTADGDAGERIARVSTTNDTATERVTVEEPPTPADFEVNITGTTEPLQAGETLGVEAEVENTGETEGTATVELIADGSTQDTDSVTVGGGETSTIALEWGTTESDEGTFLVEVDTDTTTDRDTTEVTVGPPPTDATFDISIDSTTEPVQAGEALEVDATVENIGETADTGTVELIADGTVQDTESVDLSAAGQPGDTDTVSLEWSTAADDAGDRIVQVDTSDEGKSLADTRTVEIEEAPTDAKFDVSIVGTTEPTQAGETLGVEALVENVGETQGTETVELVADGSTQDTDTVTLDGGDASTVALEWDTTESDAGDVLVEVSGTSDRATKQVTIGNPPTDATFNVDILGTTSTQAGGTLEVEAEIENVGETGNSGTVELVADGSTQDTATVDLRPAGEVGSTDVVTLEWSTAADDAGERLVEVTTDRSGLSDVEKVTVGEAPESDFEVGIESTNAPVRAGDALEVEATVENTGDDNGAETVELLVDGTAVDDRAVDLEGGDSRNVALTWNTDETDAGDRVVEVAVPGDSATREVEIEEPPTPADFEVNITGTTEPLQAGETLGVEAEVENTGETEGTATVELIVGGSTQDTDSVTVGGGETSTIALEWDTTESDEGTFLVEVDTNTTTDRDTTEVTVGPPPTDATFDISIDSTTAPVQAGEALEVAATVENVGETADTGTVELIADGTVQDTESVDLSAAGQPGDTDTVSLEWSTAVDDAGDRIAQVDTSDEGKALAATEIVVIEEPPTPAEFAVDIAGTNGPVNAGETLEVEALVENVGDTAGTDTVSLSAGGVERDNETLDLDPGETRSVVLTWDTTEGDAGDTVLRVATSNDTSTTTVTIGEAPAEADFDAEIDRTTEPLQAGETLAVQATVENVGDRAGVGNATLSVGGAERDTEEVGLRAGESRTVVLRWATTAGDAGDYVAEVRTPNDTAATTVTVGNPPTDATFDIEITQTTAPVTAGGELAVEALVENVGDTAGTGTVDLSADGDNEDTDTVDLDPGETRSVVLIWNTDTSDAGSAVVRASTPDDTSTTTVEIGDLPTDAKFDVSIERTTAPVKAGETVEVDASVENVGETPGTVTVDLLAEGGTQDSETVNVDPGDSRPVVLRWSTDAQDVGEFIIAAEGPSLGDTAIANVTSPPTDAEFEVDVTTNMGPVEEGETLELAATVENAGETAATGPVTFSVAGQARDSTIVDLDPGESRPVVLRWATTVGDAGEFIAQVETPDDGVTEIVAVEKPNEPPIASFEVVPPNPSPGEEVTFVSQSIDLDGEVQVLEWDLDGDGLADEETASSTVTRSYSTEGTVNVTLTVTDDEGATNSTTKTVEVDDFDLDDYRNQNGGVGTAGLQQAINDFVQGKIDTGELQTVINAFVQSN